MGNCTVFARYIEPAFATQVILSARLTRLYEREDWRARIETARDEAPLLLERGVSAVSLPVPVPEMKAAPQDATTLTLEQAAVYAMDQAQAMDNRAGGTPTRFTHVHAMRLHQQALKKAQEVEYSVAGQEQDRG
jgi:hypothetical protein